LYGITIGINKKTRFEMALQGQLKARFCAPFYSGTACSRRAPKRRRVSNEITAEVWPLFHGRIT